MNKPEYGFRGWLFTSGLSITYVAYKIVVYTHEIFIGFLWYFKTVVLNLFWGTEPCELHQCIHRTLRNWKNKIWFLQNIGIYKNDPTLLVWTGLYCVCLDPCRTPESDSTNPWGSIEPRLRTTVLNGSDPNRFSITNQGSTVPKPWLWNGEATSARASSLWHLRYSI